MADAVTPEISSSFRETENQDSALYHSSSSRQVLIGRSLGALTCFLLFLSMVFSFVRGRDHGVMYLLGINIMLSAILSGFLAWWFHKEVIPSDKYYFMIFVAFCMIFQAIATDIYVWHTHSTHSKS